MFETVASSKVATNYNKQHTWSKAKHYRMLYLVTVTVLTKNNNPFPVSRSRGPVARCPVVGLSTVHSTVVTSMVLFQTDGNIHPRPVYSLIAGY